MDPRFPHCFIFLIIFICLIYSPYYLLPSPYFPLFSISIKCRVSDQLISFDIFLLFRFTFLHTGIGSTIVQGMAFGTGSAIARHAVGAVVDSFSDKGSSAPAAPAPAAATNAAARAPAGPCQIDQTAFLQCMQQNSSNISACDFYYNALQQCQSTTSGGY